MSRRIAKATLMVGAATFVAVAVRAQVAEVRRNSNLRPDPSMSQPPIRVVTPPERVEVPGLVYRNGYYQVKTERGEEGWLWARNLRVIKVGVAAGSLAEVAQASNLRPSPSTAEPPVEVLDAGTQLEIVEGEPQNGYYRVRTQSGQEGWVWGQNLVFGAKRRAEVAEMPPVPRAAAPTPAGVAPPQVEIAKAPPATPTVEIREQGGVPEVPTATAVPATPTLAKVSEEPTPPRVAAEVALARDGLKPGLILDANTAELAKGLLPPEIWEHYARGEYVSKIVSYPLGNPNWEKAFVEATKENAHRLTVDEKGTIIDKSTGKMPDYLYGLPFPDIDPSDPQAGVKVIWNYFLATWYGGNAHTRTRLIMMNSRGVERELGAEGWFMFYDGQSPKYRHPNPMNLQNQFLAVALSPLDTQGTAVLFWRYRDPDVRDSQWAFVPALRRVRAVSPANRSDGYLGSDISSDDGYLFDGKPQEFQWRLLEKREGLRVVDPESLPPNSLKPRPGKEGGWDSLLDRSNYYGYEIPGWKGLPWALPQGGLALRPMYLVEAIPRDKYYLYGRLVLWIDAETYSGAYHQKFNWKGEHVLTYAVLGLPNHQTPDGQETVPVSTQTWAVAENFKMKRASLAGARLDAKSPFDRRVKIDPSIFDAGSLVRFSK
ncbi:MAG: DUF1329 domain-containing protein [Candidatus Binatia bacterium]|nr:DUF1329 domain-containing protein [Candidatus Binatia bacterium]